VVVLLVVVLDIRESREAVFLGKEIMAGMTLLLQYMELAVVVVLVL
jgi:hypothetical protein